MRVQAKAKVRVRFEIGVEGEGEGKFSTLFKAHESTVGLSRTFCRQLPPSRFSQGLEAGQRLRASPLSIEMPPRRPATDFASGVEVGLNCLYICAVHMSVVTTATRCPWHPIP